MPEPTARRPNILLIFSDQHRYDCVGSNGHPLVKTPNMDRLAAEGASFTHAFTPSPMCVPARCSLLTGQWPVQHGTLGNYDCESFKPLPPDIVTCPQVIRDAGYHTVHIGHWHVDTKRDAVAFGCHEFIPDWRYGQWRKGRGLAPVPSDAGWVGQIDTVTGPHESILAWGADQVMRQMQQAQEYGEPFYIQWHMTEPHLACRPCEPYASMYRPDQMKPWPSFADTLAKKPWIQAQMRRTWGVSEWTWDQWAPIVARYLAVITQLDDQIGRVLQSLDQLGIADNTLVVYTPDHGDMCGGHGMVDKHCVMYDDIVRVPLMMRWPGVIPAGARPEGFISNSIDLPATFCAVAGAKLPPTFAGRNLLPLACGTEPNPRPDIYSSYSGNQFGSYTQRMLRDRRWKYVWNATAEDEMYDLQTDPGELHNLVDSPEHREERSRLRGRLLIWMGEVKDTLFNGSTRKQLS